MKNEKWDFFNFGEKMFLANWGCGFHSLVFYFFDFWPFVSPWLIPFHTRWLQMRRVYVLC